MCDDRLSGERALATPWDGNSVIASTERDPSYAELAAALGSTSVAPVFLVSAASFPALDVTTRYGQ
jgi:hypothetical protein